MWFRSKTDVSSTAFQTDSNLHQQVFHSLREIPPESWNRLIGDTFPFAEYDYLLALEEGHCVGIEPGWEPRYLTLWEGKQLQAACYLYRKTNSNGEYIFDWDWANAYQRYGQRYFPKLTSAVPFTPATGPKLLVAADAPNPRELQRQLLASALELAQQEGCSCLHFLFIPAEECEIYEAAGLLLRHSFQFHWQHQGYVSAAEGAVTPSFLAHTSFDEGHVSGLHFYQGQEINWSYLTNDAMAVNGVRIAG